MHLAGWRLHVNVSYLLLSGSPILGRFFVFVKSEKKLTQSCPTLCDPMDCTPPGSSVHGILQARIREWVAIFFSVVSVIEVNCLSIHPAEKVVKHLFSHQLLSFPPYVLDPSIYVFPAPPKCHHLGLSHSNLPPPTCIFCTLANVCTVISVDATCFFSVSSTRVAF